jgi:hypothetical protein
LFGVVLYDDLLPFFHLNSGRKMKKDSFLLEFVKSGPFLLLLILAVMILLGIVIANHHRETVKMRENVLYVSPNPKK